MTEVDEMERPVELTDDLDELTAAFSNEDQNAAAWLALILLTAENRAALEGLRNLLIEKELATVEEIDKHLLSQLEQPVLGNWYTMMHKLYAYRVHETLQIQKNKREAKEEDVIQTAVDQNITPTGPPPVSGVLGKVDLPAPEKSEEEASDGN